MGHDDVEKHVDHCAFPLEVVRPRSSAETLGDLLHADDGLMIWRIHLYRFWNEEDIDIHLLCHLPVPFKIPWIFFEILRRAKLRWIDKEAHNEKISPFPALPHQTEMALMKKSHRRHKGNGSPQLPCLIGYFLHLFNIGNNFHFTKE